METILSLLIGLGIVIFTLIIGIAIMYVLGLMAAKILGDVVISDDELSYKILMRILIGLGTISVLCILFMLCHFAYEIGTNILTNIN